MGIEYGLNPTTPQFKITGPIGNTENTAENVIDYYEFLQISPNAEAATIQRVYRFLAARFHPDNPETGDPEKFLLLKRAFDLLSDPVHRADYDAARKNQQVPLSASIDFMDGIEGELNRRLALLALLYIKRRMSPDAPEVSLAEVEERMGFPRDYLDFTTWYLVSKKYITRADNSDFTLTALGVDFVESNYSSIPILNSLLNNRDRRATGAEAMVNKALGSTDGILLSTTGDAAARRDLIQVAREHADRAAGYRCR